MAHPSEHFHTQIERPPITAYIGPPFLPERPDEVSQAILPRAELLTEEVLHWHSVAQHAKNLGRITLLEIAQAERAHMRQINSHDPRNHPSTDTAKWIDTAAVVVGISRFADHIGINTGARQADAGVDEAGHDLGEGLVQIAYSNLSLRASSVLMHNDLLEESGIIFPQDNNQHYFDFPTVFVQAVSPARPPKDLQDRHLRATGERLNVYDFTMFVPRVKRSFWVPPANPFAK